jgi:PAS domain S-box-containing protein
MTAQSSSMIVAVLQLGYLICGSVTVLLLAGLATTAWRRPSAPATFLVTAMSICAAGWTVGVLGVAVSPPESAEPWSLVRRSFSAVTSWVAICGTVALTRRLAPATVALLAVMGLPHLGRLLLLHGPLVEYAPLFATVGMERIALLTREVRLATGPLYWWFTGYTYLLMTGSAALMAVWAVRSGRLGVRQGLCLIGAALVGTLFHIVGATGVLQPGVDVTPLGIGMGVLLAGRAVSRHGLLDLEPVSRNVLLDSLEDCVLVADPLGRVVDMNSAMEALTGMTTLEAAGRRVNDLLAPAGDLAARLASGPQGATLEFARRRFEVTTLPLRMRTGRMDGRLLIMRDVTLEHEQELEQQGLIVALRETILLMRADREVRTSGG